MNHTQLLNYLIEKYHLFSYLEIGVRSTAQNFDKINCRSKHGIDPDVIHHRVFTCTSDWYFENYNAKYSLIFIDGDHTAPQVERDFNNSLQRLQDAPRLNNYSFIVIHDCLPTDEITTCVPRGSQKIWHGDVYKFCMKLRDYDGINFITYPYDEGCCIVWKDETKKAFPSYLETSEWDTFKRYGKELLNVIEPSQLDKYLPKVKEVAR